MPLHAPASAHGHWTHCQAARLLAACGGCGRAKPGAGSIASAAELAMAAALAATEVKCAEASGAALRPGYIGSLSFLRTITRVVDKLRQHNPDLVYGASPPLMSPPPAGLASLGQSDAHRLSPCCRLQCAIRSWATPASSTCLQSWCRLSATRRAPHRRCPATGAACFPRRALPGVCGAQRRSGLGTPVATQSAEAGLRLLCQKLRVRARCSLPPHITGGAQGFAADAKPVRSGASDGALDPHAL